MEVNNEKVEQIIKALTGGKNLHEVRSQDLLNRARKLEGTHTPALFREMSGKHLRMSREITGLINDLQEGIEA